MAELRNKHGHYNCIKFGGAEYNFEANETKTVPDVVAFNSCKKKFEVVAKPVEEPEEKPIEEKLVKKIPKLRKKGFDGLKKVKGIGSKTLKDIKCAFGSMEELIDGLKSDKVPLRDDVVEKLRKELL